MKETVKQAQKLEKALNWLMGVSIALMGISSTVMTPFDFAPALTASLISRNLLMLCIMATASRELYWACSSCFSFLHETTAMVVAKIAIAMMARITFFFILVNFEFVNKLIKLINLICYCKLTIILIPVGEGEEVQLLLHHFV